jgi:hypothetical protein
LAIAGIGVVLTLATGGVAGVLIGSALMGAGISSTFHGAEKAIKDERIDFKSYATDVAFGALTGAVTGGLGVVGETIAANVVEQGVRAGMKKLVVRAATGAVAGVTSKAIDEVKLCLTTNRKFSDAKVTEWLSSALVGVLGGVGSHIGSNLTKAPELSSGVAKSATRVMVSGATAAACDATAQGLNIATGNQEKFDVSRTALNIMSSAAMTAGQESIKNSVYHAHGGKDKMIIDRRNKKAIRKTFGKDRRARELVEEGYEYWKDIPPSQVDSEMAKANEYDAHQASEQQRLAERRKRIDEIQIQIEETEKLRDAARASRNIDEVRQQQEKIVKLVQEKRQPYVPAPTPEKPAMMGRHNAHFLTGDRNGQAAIDVNLSGAQRRQNVSQRAVFDVDRGTGPSGGETAYKFSGYTPSHDYDTVPTRGQGAYYTTDMTFYDSKLKSTNQFTQTYTCNNPLDKGESEKKKKKE